MEMFEDNSNVGMFITDNTTNNCINNINNSGIEMAIVNENFGTFNNNSNANNNKEENIYSMYNKTNCVKDEYADLPQQYLISCNPLNFEEWQPIQESIINTEFLPDLHDISENAVNFNNHKVLDDFLLSSENPMFSCTSVYSIVNVNQQLKFSNPEPYVPKIEDDEIFCVDDSPFLTLMDPVTASPYTPTDEESPSTPQSGHSFTTSSTLYSPAPSSISTNQQTNSNKKKRGRPAKVHRDQPDPVQLKYMPDVDRKKLLDRTKNNEASRVSRRKNKEREEEEKEEERKLIERNLVLRTQYKELCKIEKKLKRVFMRGGNFKL